ncbi:MAG: hypothetical protein ACXV3F_11880 [Frankiaceae bacterium]
MNDVDDLGALIEQDRELVAGEPGDLVARTDQRTQDLGDPT